MKGEGVVEESMERERASLRLKVPNLRPLSDKRGVGGSSTENLYGGSSGEKGFLLTLCGTPQLLDTQPKPDRAGDLLENEKI